MGTGAPWGLWAFYSLLLWTSNCSKESSIFKNNERDLKIKDHLFCQMWSHLESKCWMISGTLRSHDRTLGLYLLIFSTWKWGIGWGQWFLCFWVFQEEANWKWKIRLVVNFLFCSIDLFFKIHHLLLPFHYLKNKTKHFSTKFSKGPILGLNF